MSVIVIVVGCLSQIPSALAQTKGAWPDLPVRKWSEHEVRGHTGGQRLLDHELHRQGEYQRRWHQIHDMVGEKHISATNRKFLAARGLGPALLEGENAFGDRRDLSKAIEPDILRVLLVRIAFETNRDSHLTTIPADGDFMDEALSDPGPLEIDPPPHGKSYFESHMVGLSEYYKTMSGGRLEIESQVLPEGEFDSYKLSDVADYGPGAGKVWTIEMLEKLVQDAIEAADQGIIADNLGFSLADYDDETPFTYVVFVHSGSDWQSDINGDSPNDIPTFFVNLGDPVALGGTNPAGNPGLLSECSVIPETTNQDGNAGSIAAAMYHEFGHALGLPDVYNTSTGLPSVGIWDLMDSGTNLPVTLGTVTDEGDTVLVFATGLLPPSLSAWCKWYLGWVEMGEISSPVGDLTDYRLPAVGVPRSQYSRYVNNGFGDFDLDYPQVYRAGASPKEYFLLENRWVPETTTQTPYSDLKFELDETTGVVQYLAGQFRGEWENSGMYDFFMPAGGLLVWHVNAERIAAELESNTINALGDGLRLVEADGIQDVGVLDAYVLGWLGSWRDPFGSVDINGNRTGFGDLHVDGYPGSRMHDRSYSQLQLSDIGPHGETSSSVMKFNASLDPVRTGFPWTATAISPAEAVLNRASAGARVLNPESLTPVTVNGQPGLVFTDQPAPGEASDAYATTVFAVGLDGEPIWDAVAERAEGSFLALDAPLAGPLVTKTVSTDRSDLIWATTDGRIGASLLTSITSVPTIWDQRVATNFVAGPVPMLWQGDETRYLVAAAPDSVFIISETGTVLGSGLKLVPEGGGELGELRLAVIPQAETDQAAVLTATGWFLLQQDATGLLAAPTYVAYTQIPTHTPDWTTPIPGDPGYTEFLIQDENGTVGAWTVADTGALTAGRLNPDLDGPLVCAPAVADLDGDGRHDVIFATQTRIYGLRGDGNALRGFPVRFADLFPLAAETRIQGPVIVADGTGDGVNELFFNSTGGHLFGLDATGRLMGGLPLRWGDGVPAGMAVSGDGADHSLWLVSSGGYAEGYLDRIPVNGRISAYALSPAAPTDLTTSQWLGPVGGVGRRGPTGVARDLGAAAPVYAEKDQVYLYPNPLNGDDVTVRFYSEGARDAQLAVFNLEGELVLRKKSSVVPDSINEVVLSLPGIASGLYLARVEFEGVGGVEVRTLTLAVEK